VQYSIGLNDNFYINKFLLWQMFGGVLLIFVCHLTFFPQTQISASHDDKTLIIEDAPEMEVFAFGKTVIVKKQAKGVLSFGGDVIVEGRVEGDVAAIGGSVMQKENAFIGGDVIVFGGTYRHESKTPQRNEAKETVMYAGYEEELRDLTQNPSQIFSPSFSLAFVAQRVLSMLFWFVISLGLTTLAPGAVSRAVARFQLSTLKIFAAGFAAFLLTTVTIIVSLSFLPNYLSAIFGLMAFVLLMLAYVFGRVAMQVSVGKILQKQFVGDRSRSETLAIFIGVFVWTVLLSIPYVWTFALIALFAAGIGLVLTGRTATTWQKN
jgi:hypothetical protein